MKKLWVKVYEVCPECDGTGWRKNNVGSVSVDPDCFCDNGKFGKFVDVNIPDPYMKAIKKLTKVGL